jgi:hypothetical protein
MTTENKYMFQSQDPLSWRRQKEGLGIWEHRGKVAAVGLGHSPVDRRWDEKDLNSTLGAYTILACERAMEDAGVTKDQVDGILICSEHIAGPTGGTEANWGPTRPYLDPPYDSEWGLTVVNAKWLIDQMGFKNIRYAPDCSLMPGELFGQASQAVGDGLCHTCLIIYPVGNLSGRYRRGGANAQDYAKGNAQWSVPFGNHGGNDFINVFPHTEYNVRYGGSGDDIAPFVINQHINGRLNWWGYYTIHEPYIPTTEDYLASRYILRPLRLWDCDRPVNASSAWLVSTSERAQDMKQKPIYILNHNQSNYPTRSSQTTLNEIEAATDRAARMLFEGSGIGPADIDVFNPYDGFSLMTQFWLEAFQYQGVKRGDAYAYYAGDISVKGPHPFNSSGGNLGNGRTRSAMFVDSMEQLRGTAGERQVTIKAEIAVCGLAPPMAGGWVTFSTSPD